MPGSLFLTNSYHYLNYFADLINNKTPCRLISYTDDFVIMHKKPFTQLQLALFKDRLESEGLKLNEVKTRLVNMSKQRSEFDFLGYNFKKVPCFWRNGHWYLKVQPSKKSQMKFKETIRKVVKHRTSKTLEQLIDEVNPIILGWDNYFSQCGYPQRVFFKMDWFVVGRFYRWSKRLSQRSQQVSGTGCVENTPEKRFRVFRCAKGWHCEGCIVKKQNRAG